MRKTSLCRYSFKKKNYNTVLGASDFLHWETALTATYVKCLHVTCAVWLAFRPSGQYIHLRVYTYESFRDFQKTTTRIENAQLHVNGVRTREEKKFLVVAWSFTMGGYASKIASVSNTAVHNVYRGCKRKYIEECDYESESDYIDRTLQTPKK